MKDSPLLKHNNIKHRKQREPKHIYYPEYIEVIEDEPPDTNDEDKSKDINGNRLLTEKTFKYKCDHNKLEYQDIDDL